MPSCWRATTTWADTERLGSCGPTGSAPNGGKVKYKPRAAPVARRPDLIDLVQRDFHAQLPNTLWFTDIERHEALLNRAVVKGHRLRSVVAGRVKLRAA